ncbi:CCHC-type zinc finger protein CG3800-like [Helianthus annuus]|uniref:CCHC-type zinc finger protein CG3800-like n=1 Tax=Helianthus annuus TaxID=4232 RepID=UPI000B8F2B89|nr:CCHC-type zinc finger protein CG3800-like [Helianthus annuus]
MPVKASSEGKREREEENSHRSDKKKKGSFKNKKDSEFRKNSSQSNNRPKCSNCRKQHSGKCTIDPRAKLCGICKTKGHKTLDCKELKNAICYNCNEEGHIKTNYSKLIKKHREARETNV